IESERLSILPARKQAVIGRAGIADHQPRRVGVTHEIFEIDLLRPEQLVDERADQHAIRAWLDADPLIRNGIVARLYRIDGDELDPARLELAERHLDGVGGVVL